MTHKQSYDFIYQCASVKDKMSAPKYLNIIKIVLIESSRFPSSIFPFFNILFNFPKINVPEYKHYWAEFVSVLFGTYHPMSIQIEEKMIEEYFLCKGL